MMTCGWAVKDRRGYIRYWTFRNRRRDSIADFIGMKPDVKKAWKAARKDGFACVRVVIMEADAQAKQSLDAFNWRRHVEKTRAERKTYVAPRPFFEPGAQG